MLHADVAVPVPLGQAFSYSIPDALKERVCRGARVVCEFGRRRVLGVVLSVSDGPLKIPAEKVKPLRGVVDSEPVLPEELLAFLMELSRYYLAPIGEVMRLALPAVERGTTSPSLLDGARADVVGRLVQVAAAVPGVEVPSGLRGQQPQVLEALKRQGPSAVTQLEKVFGNARAALRRLHAAGLVTLEKQASVDDPFFSTPATPDVPPELTDDQSKAVEAIYERLAVESAHSFLLHGVTASGKTEVYLRAAARCLEHGGSAIVLVPEISLTPQLVSRFRARLGDAIAVLHSGLSAKERHGMWKSLRSGSLRVAIGARSALFAPVERLRLVCVDEEHDSSFKQEEGVRYSARDMALLRAHRAGAVCVLGSATPSIASEALVRTGKLERLTLPARARLEARLPNVEVVDLRRTGAAMPGERLISVPLFRALERVVKARQQAILFLNRRGFSPSLVCDDCGQVAECPNCSVALTVHRARGHRLVCHYCDYTTLANGRCAACQSESLAEEGTGTERIETGLKELLPGARVARLDRDVASGLKSEKILDRMRAGEIDILVGTQMVTKGHDLPRVTLVGVLNADAALSLPDFRAAERTFQLIVQVAGRAGRGTEPGTVVVQTRQPGHPAVALAVKHDVAAFVEQELGERRELRYPPFSRLGLVRIDAAEESVARDQAEELAQVARAAATEGLDILGPAPAPIARLRNRYRYRFLVRSEARAPLRAVLNAVRRHPADRRARVSIDVDPVSML